MPSWSFAWKQLQELWKGSMNITKLYFRDITENMEEFAIKELIEMLEEYIDDQTPEPME